MKSRRIDLTFQPIRLHKSLDVVGSVPDRQSYRADLDEYTPDYTLTPLILQPIINVAEDSMIIQPGRGNKDLAKIKWVEVINGVRKDIATGVDYNIITSGDDAGRLIVKKNVSPSTPVTLEFEAEYVDKRSGELYKIQLSHLLKSKDATEAVVVDLDIPSQSFHNPLRSSPTQRINASVRVGSRKAAPSEYTLRWEKKDDNADWHTIGTDILDYDVTVGGGFVEVNKQHMGREVHIRCTASYLAGGGTGRTRWDSAASVVSLVRRIPQYDFEMSDVPENIAHYVDRLSPKMVVADNAGIIENPEREMEILWYVDNTNNGGSISSYTMVGHGENPTIPIKPTENANGAMLAYDAKDRGPLFAIKDADGNYIKDASGAPLLIH